MADKPNIEVLGLNKLIRDLKRLNPDITKEIKEVNKGLATIVAGSAASKAPKRTGALAASIRAGGTQRSGVVRAGKKKVPYAGPIHFGWPGRNISPNTFLWDALDARKGEVEAKWLAAMQKIVDGVD